MWWRAADDDPSLFDQLRALVQFRRETIQSDQPLLVYGLGSIIRDDLARVLALVDYRLLSGYAFDQFQDMAHKFADDASAIPWLPYREFQGLTDGLVGWPLPDDSVVMLATPPMPLHQVSPDSEIRHQDSQDRAAGGVPILLTDIAGNQYKGLLTVGHLVQNVRDRIELRLPSRKTQLVDIGEVVAFCDPAGRRNPEYDYAVVMIDDARTSLGPFVHRGVMPTPTGRVAFEGGKLYGSLSGTVNVQLDGALTVVGDGITDWADCWRIVPNGVSTIGDSGSLVTKDATQELVGYLVGGSLWPGRRGLQHQYVQHLERIIANVNVPQYQLAVV